MLYSLWHLLWHNVLRLWLIVLTRLYYFKQLIAKFKKYREEMSISEEEESIMYDYLVKMAEFKSSGTPTNFSGTSYCQIISHRRLFSLLIVKSFRNSATLDGF
jgi:hypothetical protein